MNKLSVIIFCYFLVHSAHAQDNCHALQANRVGASGTYAFRQYAFENKSDLAIIDPQAEVRRVTFGRGNASNGCFFQPLAFAEGDKLTEHWGWHLLWQEGTPNSAAKGLFYARMDGEAWVSSLPKQFTKFSPINPQFKLDAQAIIVTWQQIENSKNTNMQAVSYDEGRSWVIKPATP